MMEQTQPPMSISSASERIRVVSRLQIATSPLVNMTQLPGATDNAASFQFDGEDHTLGNALRFMIMKK